LCDFQCEKGKSAKARKFVNDMLPRRGPDAFERFIASLMRCEQQQFIAEELDPELARKYGAPDAGTDNVDASVSKMSDDDIIQEVSGSIGCLCFL